ncbi:MAG: nuclear transport factor 2 family protein [Pseudomonadota bacterium]
MTELAHPEINNLMERYFEGLYQSDSTILRDVFHHDLAYVNGTSGTYEHMDLEAYMARIDARTPPASRGEPREEVIERITLKGDRIGLVEARMTMLGRKYQDLLTLLHTDSGWRVLTKVFSFVERKD